MNAFDQTPTPTFIDQPHAYSIDTPIPHSEQIDLFGPDVQTSGSWTEGRLRGTATRYLASEEQGARIQIPFSGKAISIRTPMEFTPPGPRYKTPTGTLKYRLDGNTWAALPHDRGREIIVGNNLSSGPHTLEIECSDLTEGTCGIETLRVWPTEIPSTIFGKINGNAMLTDLRADITGLIQYSRTIRNARTGYFSLILPRPGTYQINLHATGWKSHTLNVDITTPGQTVELPDINLSPLEPISAPPRPLSPDEPLVLVCFAHANIWGQESAEWLTRRIPWINSQNPHAVLDANEVNPSYVAGALRDLQCPWITCSGNHSMPQFDAFLPDLNREFSLPSLRILTAGYDIGNESTWTQTLSQFAEQDTLRILCSYEPFAPLPLLKRHKVRFFFYGHSRLEGPLYNNDGTTFLRKVDANTFYRVEIGPPHDFSAPITIERHVSPREQ